MEKITTVKTTNQSINLSESNFPRKEFNIIIETLDNKKIEIPSSSKLTKNDLEPFSNDIQNAIKITIPEGITELEHCLFKKHENLQFVFLPSTLKLIPPEAFLSCKKLKEVHIAEGTQYIEFCAFKDCTNLEKLFLPESLKNVCGYAFSNCKSLRMLYLSKNVERIIHRAFENCVSLEEMIIHKKTDVSRTAFANCSSNLIISRYN